LIDVLNVFRLFRLFLHWCYFSSFFNSISRGNGEEEGETKGTKGDLEAVGGGMLRSASTANLRQIDDVLLYSMGKEKGRDSFPDKNDGKSKSKGGGGGGTRGGVEPQRPPSKVLSAQRLAVAMREAAKGFHGPSQGIGIDAEDSKTFVKASETFLDRNFTTAERRYAEESVV
jgi:hypothetical protein